MIAKLEVRSELAMPVVGKEQGILVDERVEERQEKQHDHGR